MPELRCLFPGSCRVVRYRTLLDRSLFWAPCERGGLRTTGHVVRSAHDDQALKAEIFTVDRQGPGRISTMARPRGGDWLEYEMRALVDARTDVLVSMLTDSETVELNLLAEREAATAIGIRFLCLPTADRDVPAVAPFRSLLDDLTEELRQGRHVVIHCRLGVGRSSLVAAGLLIREGHQPDDAWAIVRKARGLDVLDTVEQRAWLESVARA